MRTVKLKSSILVGICTLLAVLGNIIAPQNKNLKDITKPYLGVYECKSAQLGEKDLLEEFSHIVLELKTDGVFVLHYGHEKGGKQSLHGKYVYDSEKQTIVLKTAEKICFQREFPLRKGQIIVSLPIAQRQLCLIFEQK